MSKTIIICIKCQKVKQHAAKGLCTNCYQNEKYYTHPIIYNPKNRLAAKAVGEGIMDAAVRGDNESLFNDADFLKHMGLSCSQKGEKTNG